MNTKRTAALVAGIVVAIVGAPVAGASPVNTQYDNPTPSVVTEQPTVTPIQPAVTPTQPTVKQPTVKAASAKATGAKATGTVKKSKPVKVKAVKPAAKPVAKPAPVVASLPFTGLDLGIVLLFGGVAIAGGLGLRHVAARRRHL
jgi:hypothetical protein